MIEPSSTKITNGGPSHSTLIKGAIWTIGAYGFGNLVRFASNVVLARILAPDLFGLMLVVSTLRTGLELVSDVGIGQNIIYSKNAENPEFYNTAWTLQVFRGVALWIICAVLAIPAADLYKIPALIEIMPTAALVSILIGVTSISVFLVRKRLEIAKLNSFEMLMVSLSTIAQIAIAYISPTIWALVIGSIVGTGFTTIGSYFLLSNVNQRFVVSREYFWEIMNFGKWIYLSSLVYFLSMNFDRLYLAKIIPLSLLGIYGIARNISELASALISKLGGTVVFPFLVSHSHVERDELRRQLAPIRLQFIFIAGFGVSVFASIADLLVHLVYDQRYQSAGWMLSVFAIGAWFSILANLNEATLLGFGKPSYSALGNTLKFGFLGFGLVAVMPRYGMLGGVIVVAAADLLRYIPIFVGQFRQRFSFGCQDIIVTVATLGLIVLWEYLRQLCGLGTSFDRL